MDMWLYAGLVGTGATALSDGWALLRRRLFAVALPNYGLVGRWFGHMPRGLFVHEAIAKAAPVPVEHLLGWTAHYLIGVAYAALLLAIWGEAWLQQPTLGPALIVGVATVVAPFFVMQPGMGAGIAARRTPHPAAARLHSVVMHAAFGLGLYLAGWLCKGLLLS